MLAAQRREDVTGMEDDEIEMQLDRIVDQAWEGSLRFKLA